MEQQAILDNLNAEKIALDQSYVAQIRECVELRKQLYLKDKCLADMNKQVQDLLKEVESLKKSSELIEECST